MANLDDIVSSFEEKVEQVIRFADGLKDGNRQLQQQVDELSAKLRAKSQEMEVLESKYQSLKLAKTLAPSSEDIKNVKLKVNRMVREIDKCIALLNR